MEITVIKEWEAFLNAVKPIGEAANAIPLFAFNPNKADILELMKRSKNIIPHLSSIKYLGGAFESVVDEHIEDPFLRNWVNLLCFLISGLTRNETNAAAMATLFRDWFKPNA